MRVCVGALLCQWTGDLQMIKNWYRNSVALREKFVSDRGPLENKCCMGVWSKPEHVLRGLIFTP